jgi:ABC-type multidrug transport system ATPase subunit
VAAFHDVVRRIRDQRDLTVLVSSHVLDEVEALCESVAVVHDGSLRAAGDVGTLKAAVPTPPRVTARIVDGEYAPAAATAAQFGTVASATPDRLVVECPRESVGDLFDALVSDPHVGGIEVAEPGLDDVFDRALAGAASNGGAA